MSSPISSSSSLSKTDEEDSLEEEIGDFSGFIPYDESLEPIATVTKRSETMRRTQP